MKSCSVWYLMLVELLDSWNVCYWIWMQLARFFVTRNHMKSRPFAWGYYTNPLSLPTWQAVDISKIWCAVQGTRGCFKAMNTFGFIFFPETLCSCRGCLVALLQDDQDVLADRNRSQVDPIFPRSTMLSCGYERISGQGPMDLWMMQFTGVRCFFLSRCTKHLQLFFLVLDKMWEFFLPKRYACSVLHVVLHFED